MFCITLALSNNPAVWTLLYKDEAKATEAFSKVPQQAGDSATLTDDFGQIAKVKGGNIAAALFENLEESKMAHVERALHNARTQAKAQQMATNDPILRTARMAHGPDVFNPIGPNGMHR